MSGALAHPASSSQDQQLQASANGGDLQNDVYIDISIVELSETIDREMHSSAWPSIRSQGKTIFRVPNKERLQAAAADKSTYEPSFLSIGPYHANATEKMRRNEEGKLWNLHSRTQEQGRDGKTKSVLDYTRAVYSMEERARRCYEGGVDMDGNAFCRMLLLDAFQVIAMLETLEAAAAAAEEDDATELAETGAGAAQEAAASQSSAAAAAQGQGCDSSSVMTEDTILTFRDMMMMENQIPFFVVEEIYELHYGRNGWNANAATATATATATMRPARRLAWKAISVILGKVPSSVPNDDRLSLEFQHLVHVCHVYLKPTCQNINVSTETPNNNLTGNYGRFRRATEYYEAGVTIRQWCWEEGSSASERRMRPMLDVAFSDGVLSVALQEIDENTGWILRNLLAYEQKYHRTATSAGSSYVTAYVVFMSQLLGSADDVALLSRRGVLEHQLGDDGEVCALFRGLADGLAVDPSSDHYLSPVQVALQAHCRHRWYRWRAWIVRHRFSNPWLVAAWLFGGFAVLCTIIQTVFTVLSYVQHQH